MPDKHLYSTSEKLDLSPDGINPKVWILDLSFVV